MLDAHGGDSAGELLIVNSGRNNTVGYITGDKLIVGNNERSSSDGVCQFNGAVSSIDNAYITGVVHRQ